MGLLGKGSRTLTQNLKPVSSVLFQLCWKNTAADGSACQETCYGSFFNCVFNDHVLAIQITLRPVMNDF
jgi:hypothetical protein